MGGTAPSSAYAIPAKICGDQKINISLRKGILKKIQDS
jgi:hypothetical protein